MIAGNQQNLIAPPADDDVEMLKDVPTQHAHVRCRGICERNEIAPDSGHAAAFTSQFQSCRYDHKGTRATHPAHGDVRCLASGDLEVLLQQSRKRSAVSACVNKEALPNSSAIPICHPDSNRWSPGPVLTLPPFATDYHRCAALA